MCCHLTYRAGLLVGVGLQRVVALGRLSGRLIRRLVPARSVHSQGLLGGDVPVIFDTQAHPGCSTVRSNAVVEQHGGVGASDFEAVGLVVGLVGEVDTPDPTGRTRTTSSIGWSVRSA